MAAKVDVESGFKKVSDHLASLGFTPRDADGNDFAASETDIRFKVGTAYSEVTVTVWQGARQVGTYRALDETGLTNLLGMLDYEAMAR